jgi:hypothetical protein
VLTNKPSFWLAVLAFVFMSGLTLITADYVDGLQQKSSANKTRVVAQLLANDLSRYAAHGEALIRNIRHLGQSSNADFDVHLDMYKTLISRSPSITPHVIWLDEKGFIQWISEDKDAHLVGQHHSVIRLVDLPSKERADMSALISLESDYFVLQTGQVDLENPQLGRLVGRYPLDNILSELTRDMVSSFNLVISDDTTILFSNGKIVGDQRLISIPASFAGRAWQIQMQSLP